MMDNWTKEFLAFCDAVNQDIEVFWEELEQVTEEFDEMVHHMEDTITEEIEEVWQVFFDPLLDIDWEEEVVDEESDFVMTAKVYPDQNTHPACQGCRHYHGYVYGDNLFVCAMHPYGWPDQHCPDWEGNDNYS